MSPPATDRRPRVVIVGGGFGGLWAARRLARTPAEVVVVDRLNYHLFQPLLYQVATAALSPADIAAPIRSILRAQRNVRVLMDEVRAVDLRGRLVRGALGEIAWDFLILACGATHTYFGHDEWAAAAPGLKTIDDALEIRRRVLLAFEAAEMEDDAAARRARLTFVVVGGGPTGVEMAGALREIATTSIPADFRRVDTRTARIILVEGEERLLPAMSTRASARARRDLERMGIEVRLHTRATAIDSSGVRLGDERLAADNVIWAAGVAASPLAGTLGVPLDHAGRVRVRPDCSVPGHPDLFVIGDLAAQVDAATGRPVPGVAQGAMQMGAFVARIIHDAITRGTPADRRPAFVYANKGDMATIGKARAVADIGGVFLAGLPAWLAWCFVHIVSLIGFRNKLSVMLSWAWQYAFHSRGARLITGSPGPRVARPVEMGSRETDL